jgi:hypothetical protein
VIRSFQELGKPYMIWARTLARRSMNIYPTIEGMKASPSIAGSTVYYLENTNPRSKTYNSNRISWAMKVLQDHGFTVECFSDVVDLVERQTRFRARHANQMGQMPLPSRPYILWAHNPPLGFEYPLIDGLRYIRKRDGSALYYLPTHNPRSKSYRPDLIRQLAEQLQRSGLTTEIYTTLSELGHRWKQLRDEARSASPASNVIPSNATVSHPNNCSN